MPYKDKQRIFKKDSSKQIEENCYTCEFYGCHGNYCTKKHRPFKSKKLICPDYKYDVDSEIEIKHEEYRVRTRRNPGNWKKNCRGIY